MIDYIIWLMRGFYNLTLVIYLVPYNQKSPVNITSPLWFLKRRRHDLQKIKSNNLSPGCLVHKRLYEVKKCLSVSCVQKYWKTTATPLEVVEEERYSIVWDCYNINKTLLQQLNYSAVASTTVDWAFNFEPYLNCLRTQFTSHQHSLLTSLSTRQF